MLIQIQTFFPENVRQGIFFLIMYDAVKNIHPQCHNCSKNIWCVNYQLVTPQNQFFFANWYWYNINKFLLKKKLRNAQYYVKNLVSNHYNLL